MTPQLDGQGRAESGDGPLDILLIEDDPAYARIVDRFFRSSHGSNVRIDHVNGMDVALQRIEEASYSLVLSDLGLQDSNGIETVERLFAASPETPLVVLTANDDNDLALDAMKSGAQDYLVKGAFDAEMLSRVVRYAIERKKSQQHIAWLAHHDTVTGLPNRALFQDRLEQVIARCQRDKTRAALHFLDLDRFKHVNDTFGHYVGDALLAEVGRRLRATVREVDTVARLGGDEFVIIETDVCRARDGASLARKVLAAFEQPFRIEDKEIPIGVSLGIAVFPNDGETASDLQQSADITLNAVKADERGTFRFFDSQMRSELKDQQKSEAELARAIENDEFELFYQPKYDLWDGQTIGVEALIRWCRPDGEIVPPDRFIPIAEASGQINRLGEWVIHRACTDGARLRRDTGQDLSVAINLSAVELKNPLLCDTVFDALEKSGLPPELLEIEVTETAMIDDRSNVVYRTMSRLRERGIGLAIDDFGTGYASFSQLMKFPFTAMKIDRSFVADIGKTNEAVEIIRAIIGLSRGLSKSVVAEGIEDVHQVDMLLSEGCRIGQGFGYSRPLPYDDLIAFLANDPEERTGTFG